MNRTATMTLRYLAIWATLAGLALGGEWAWRKARQRREDMAWAIEVARRVQARKRADEAAGDYLRFLEATWDDDAGVDIFDNEGGMT